MPQAIVKDKSGKLWYEGETTLVRAFVCTDVYMAWNEAQMKWLKLSNEKILKGTIKEHADFHPVNAPVSYHEDEYMLIEELPELREQSKRSINRHSTRYYHIERHFFVLDRTTDASPPFFTLEILQHDPRKPTDKTYIPRRMKVETSECWGSGYSWPKAELAMMQALFGHLLELGLA